MATSELILKYTKEFDDAFPPTFEFGSPWSASISYQTLSIPGVHRKIRSPLYMAGFYISTRYFINLLKDRLDWHDPIMFSTPIGAEWERRGEPKPFVFPKVMTRSFSEFIVFFVTSECPTERIQEFVDNREAIMSLIFDIVKFTPEEADFIRKNLKWQRYSFEDRALPDDRCLTYRSLVKNSSDT
ncbi:hypothetical protein CC1G_07231 [Coprinopsis cinerea okayama7|uniref:Uncharacterized protein n=1 Tax=Coprinopsis cinerea (strain Okayama-7 / 130 / ATCC MYA-4618 / FGSC 9003) TaxID=240176 RepID=A8PD08_COPC7|nr:hypothetical protein CC1G_07231 [Coprinopsis cinerea okayama7\|eukprot:XP_001840501.1 hypothetical protein CC1G_07231 [Coprinopsis cinerea okayama7\